MGAHGLLDGFEGLFEEVCFLRDLVLEEAHLMDALAVEPLEAGDDLGVEWMVGLDFAHLLQGATDGTLVLILSLHS